MPSASLPLSAVVALGGLMLSGVLQAQSSPIWQSFPAPDQSPHSPIAELHLSDDGSALSLHRRNLAKLYLTADLGAHWQVDSFEAYGAPSGSSGPWAVASHSLSANGQILRALVGTLSGSQLQVGQIPWRGWPVESLDGGRTWRSGPWHQTAKPSDRPSMVRLLLNSLDGMAGFAFSSYQLNVNSAQEFPWVLLEPTQARLWEGNNAWGDHFTLPVEWISAACSADGKILLAVVQKTAPSDRTQRWRHLVTSSDWGRTWVLRLNAGSQPWNCCAVSANGTVMLAAANPGGLLLSRDSGSNWSAVQPLNNAAQPWSAVALSTGGQIMAALTPATLTASTDGGAHWAALRQSNLAAGGNGDFLALAMTHSGAKLAVADNHGDLHLGSSLIADTAPLPFGLSLHPQSCNTNVGTAATLRIALLGADENTQVTWYTGPSGTVSPALKTATGAAGLNFQTDGQLSLGAHSFWARIQNAGVTVDSFAAIVKVAKPPRLVMQPSDQFLRLGTRAQPMSLAIENDSPTNLSYQWYRGEQGETSRPVVGATESRFNPGLLPAGDHWFWADIVSSEGGRVQTRSAQIHVGLPAKVIAQPQSIGLPKGQSARLEVRAEGDAPLLYQWYRIEKGRRMPIEGATEPILELDSVSEPITAHCQISNALRVGTRQLSFLSLSANATITPLEPIRITTQPLGQTLPIDRAATLSVKASGGHPKFPLRYQWYLGQRGNTSVPMQGASAASPVFSTALLTQVKNTSYWVRVFQGDSQIPVQFQDSESATLEVKLPALTLRTPPVDASNPVGGYSIFAVKAVSGGSQYPLQYQWFELDAKGNSSPVAGAIEPTFLSLNDKAPGTYLYWVRLYQGPTLSPIQSLDSPTAQHIVTLPALRILSQPSSLRLRLGARPTLKVVAAGGTPHYPLQYQWYRGAKGDNRQPLEGARLPTYQGPSADQLGEFSFWVRIYQNNSRGELLQDLQSEPATLSVQP